jgi:hypothetical protein
MSRVRPSCVTPIFRARGGRRQAGNRHRQGQPRRVLLVYVMATTCCASRAPR